MLIDQGRKFCITLLLLLTTSDFWPGLLEWSGELKLSGSVRRGKARHRANKSAVFYVNCTKNRSSCRDERSQFTQYAGD
jgi:hypothetical protein